MNASSRFHQKTDYELSLLFSNANRSAGKEAIYVQQKDERLHCPPHHAPTTGR
jgi:hypothetical protein